MSSFKRKATRQDIPAKRRQVNKHVFYAPCSVCGRMGDGENERVHLGEGVFKIVCQECEWQIKKGEKK